MANFFYSLALSTVLCVALVGLVSAGTNPPIVPNAYITDLNIQIASSSVWNGTLYNDGPNNRILSVAQMTYTAIYELNYFSPTNASAASWTNSSDCFYTCMQNTSCSGPTYNECTGPTTAPELLAGLPYSTDNGTCAGGHGTQWANITTMSGQFGRSVEVLTIYCIAMDGTPVNITTTALGTGATVTSTLSNFQKKTPDASYFEYPESCFCPGGGSYGESYAGSYSTSGSYPEHADRMSLSDIMVATQMRV